jgi:hypothetical protein
MAGLGGIPSSPPFSDETVDRVKALLNSGEIDVDQVSSYFSVPVPAIIQALTGISRDAYTSGDNMADADVDAVMKMVNSGVASTTDVADYFSATEEVVESYLTDVELYTAEDIANVRQGIAVASAAARNIEADGDYTEEEIKVVADSINNGLLSTAQAAQQFNVPESEIISNMEIINQRNAEANAAAALAAQNAAALAAQNAAVTPVTPPPVTPTTVTPTALGGATTQLPAPTAMSTLMPQMATTAYNTGSQIPTGLRGSEMAQKGGAAGAIQMLDQINRTGRGDLAGRYNAGLTAAQEAATTAQGYISPYQEAGTNALQQQLALSGALGQDAFNAAYQESPQMAFLREQGMRANLAGAGATGGLGGGNVQKELQRFGQGLASQGLQQQIGNLGQIATQGYNAGRDLSNISTGLGSQQLSTQQNLGNQLTQLGSNTGMAAASNLSSLGNNLASGRTRAGEQLANQYGAASNYLADTYSQQGSNIAGLIGSQANNINAQNEAAANNAARGQVGYGSALSGIQSGMGSQISGVPNTPIAQPNYADAVGNALGAGGFAYDMFQPNKTQNQGFQQSNPNGYFTNQQTQGFGNFYYGQPNTATLVT